MAGSSEPLKDYYVGMVRGYLLAKDADKRIMHAFDLICEAYQTSAGELIGEEPKPKDVAPTLQAREETLSRIREKLQSKLDKPSAQTVKTKQEASPKSRSWRHWTSDDDEDLIRMHENGSDLSSMAYELDRTKAAVKKRIADLRTWGKLQPTRA